MRKIRFAPKRFGRGKRGAFRVCYAYFEKVRVVLLVVAYGKNERDDLSPEAKKSIRDHLAREEEYLSKGPNP